MAIQISGVHKSYGRGSRRTEVLRGLDMHIPRGHIYGLLGPSGCGKTTLLQCIVGKRLTEAGSVLVFGAPPGSAQSGVPGPRVGYMPQVIIMIQSISAVQILKCYSIQDSFYFRRANIIKTFYPGNRSLHFKITKKYSNKTK